jgi:hypothetical protein
MPHRDWKAFLAESWEEFPQFTPSAWIGRISYGIPVHFQTEYLWKPVDEPFNLVTSTSRSKWQWKYPKWISMWSIATVIGFFFLVWVGAPTNYIGRFGSNGVPPMPPPSPYGVINNFYGCGHIAPRTQVNVNIITATKTGTKFVFFILYVIFSLFWIVFKCVFKCLRSCVKCFHSLLCCIHS